MHYAQFYFQENRTMIKLKNKKITQVTTNFVVRMSNTP